MLEDFLQFITIWLKLDSFKNYPNMNVEVTNLIFILRSRKFIFF